MTDKSEMVAANKAYVKARAARAAAEKAYDEAEAAAGEAYDKREAAANKACDEAVARGEAR